MIKRTEVGLLISGDELLTPNGRLIAELYDELKQMERDRDWWRKCACGYLWLDAVDEYESDEPF
jgi:putative heme degradation protein